MSHAEDKGLLQFQDITDHSIVRIRCISVRQLEDHSVQETVWVEDIVQMANVCATKVIREQTVVCIFETLAQNKVENLNRDCL